MHPIFFRRRSAQASHRDLIITLAARDKLPAVYSERSFVTWRALRTLSWQLAAYEAAVKRSPKERIMLRQEARVMARSKRRGLVKK